MALVNRPEHRSEATSGHPPAPPAHFGLWRANAARGSGRLRTALISIDVLAVALGWTMGTIGSGVVFSERLAIIMAATAAAVAAITVQRLYLARVAVVRTVELARLLRAAVVSVAGAYVAGSVSGWTLSFQRGLVAASLSFGFLAVARSFFDAWLKMCRAQGRFLRPMLIVGANSEGADLEQLLRTHPELGYRTVGFVGEPAAPELWVGVPRIGDLDHVGQAVRRTGANGVVIAASALSPRQLNVATRDLLYQGVHVHISSGLKGIAPQRVRHLPLAHEPLFYLERIELAPWQLVLKRVIDIVLASIMLVVSAPFVAAAAIIIKATDRGSVLFKQERVGRDGRRFTMLKLRTMSPGSDRRLDEVASRNERSGPLFKVANDPRRTRIGQVLELLSFDEIPQLWNVMRGEMSLVGPRPALPHEVEQFDDELLIRLSVPPGVTGLWQVEARENPEFDAYRRLDIFYVENWSVALDFGILVATFRSLILRLFGRRHRARTAQDAATVRAGRAQRAATRPAS